MAGGMLLLPFIPVMLIDLILGSISPELSSKFYEISGAVGTQAIDAMTRLLENDAFNQILLNIINIINPIIDFIF